MKSKWIIASILIVALICLCGASIFAVWQGAKMAQEGGIRLDRWGADAVEAKETEEKTLAVSGPVSLSVTGDFGDISVESGGDGQVLVKAEKTAYGVDDADAQAQLKNLKVVIEQRGNTVKISVQRPVEVGVLHIGPGTGSVKFTISVPKDTAVALATSNGDLSLKGTSGKADLETDFGKVTVRDVPAAVAAKSQTGTVDAQNVGAEGEIALSSEFGEITLDTARGSDVNVSSNNGKLTVKKVDVSGLLKVSSEFGAVTVNDAQSKTADFHSGNGKVKLTKVEVAGDVKVSSNFGDLDLENVTASGYDLSTQNGKIRVDGAQGQIKAHSEFGEVEVLNGREAILDLSSNNGSVTFSGSLAEGPHVLKSEFGNIEVTFPAETALDVDLKTGFGKITSDFDITLSVKGEEDEKHLQGKINGGGAKLTVETNNGNIVLIPGK